MSDPADRPDPAQAPAVHDPPPIEQQRAELAQTVDALTAKLDVQTRVSKAAAENRQMLIGAAVAAVLGVAGIVVVRRKRRKEIS